MVVVASAGLNLPRGLVAHCQIEETPQQVVIDGMQYDTRSFASYQALRQQVEQARTPPYPLGSSAAEYVGVLNKLLRRTDEILIVTGTRKLLGTYDAAVAATRILRSTRIDIRVLDTGLVELGAGLVAAYCAAASRSRPDLSAIVRAGEALSRGSMQLCLPSDESLSKSGRFDLARSVWQSIPGGTPVIGMKDGELRPLTSQPSREEAAEKLLELLQQRYEPHSALWVSVTYADDPLPARELLARLRRLFDVRYAIVHQLNPMAFLFLGSKAICVTAHPVSAMNVQVKLPEV